jgi:hypothetical protein
MKVIYLVPSLLCSVMIMRFNILFVIGVNCLKVVYLNCFLILVRKLGIKLMIIIPVQLKGIIM